MRSQLIELGYDVPVRNYLFEPAELSKSTQSQPEVMPQPSQYHTAHTTGLAAIPERECYHSICDKL